MKLFRILDPFTLTLITVVLLASFFPGGRQLCACR
ncbi:transporter, bile acid/Na+ symporter family [Salmonella enterica subsp. enterica serovar Sanjuan]|uniref:Transporter, bile acid/Na+ symporter family n=1 Tax=Salmonella enterica subsp. enterica serovar Sanjuan TaxID=1160765 RepID=A0A3S4GVM8_SALET|nr:transporter, bile acid/Na+ symporter family [Salmonella enterica subsp. enterica serovar Sanjuan]